jgi:hypothetical protein
MTALTSLGRRPIIYRNPVCRRHQNSHLICWFIGVQAAELQSYLGCSAVWAASLGRAAELFCASCGHRGVRAVASWHCCPAALLNK